MQVSNYIKKLTHISDKHFELDIKFQLKKKSITLLLESIANLREPSLSFTYLIEIK